MFIFKRLRKVLRKGNIEVNFEKISNEWLEYKQNTVKQSTYCIYVGIVEKYLKPNFKKLNFNETINYNNFIQNISKTLSPKTTRCVVMVLKAILKYYEEEYEQTLKIKRASLPKAEPKSIKILTKRERLRIENYCFENMTLKNIGIIICMNTGLRLGEICGLKWENINLEERKIYVRNTLERIYNRNLGKSKIIIDTPKSICSIREIPMSNKLFNLLKPLKKKYKDKDFLLTGKEKYLDPRTYQNHFKVILKKLRIKYKNFHVLRHTFATECLEVGMDVKSLSEILGHSDVGITLKVYVHSSDKMKTKFLDKL